MATLASTPHGLGLGLLLACALALAGALCPLECCPSGACTCGYASCDGLGLDHVPSGFFPNVSYLDLGHNRLQELSDLSGFPNIRTLYVNHNRLRALDLSQFPARNALDNIYATNNKISSIRQPPPGVAFPLVTSLFLSSNDLSALREGDLDSFGQLESLMLESNPLQRLDVAAVDGRFKSSGIIRMANTPLACACAYEELSRWAKGAGVYINANCEGRAPCPF